MKGWNGPRKGPCTLGEAKVMTAIICGAQPDDIEGFVVIGVVKCENCGEPHNLVTNQNMSPKGAVAILMMALENLVEEL
jgi:hypothetical protein